MRTVTSHNKPVGYVERDWTYDQATLSGDVYESLTDSQLRALNIEPSRVAHLRNAAPAQARENVEVIEVESKTGKHAL